MWRLEESSGASYHLSVQRVKMETERKFKIFLWKSRFAGYGTFFLFLRYSTFFNLAYLYEIFLSCLYLNFTIINMLYIYNMLINLLGVIERVKRGIIRGIFLQQTMEVRPDDLSRRGNVAARDFPYVRSLFRSFVPWNYLFSFFFLFIVTCFFLFSWSTFCFSTPSKDEIFWVRKYRCGRGWVVTVERKMWFE